MEAAVVYRFHIALRGVNSKIWRRMEPTGGSSLANLQRVIQISLGWSDEYQHRFCIRNHYLGASRPGGLHETSARQVQAHPLGWKEIEEFIDGAGESLRADRERALLCVAHETLARHGELVALEVRDVDFHTNGTGRALIRRGKTDDAGQGRCRFHYSLAKISGIYGHCDSQGRLGRAFVLPGASQLTILSLW
jgi:hypothetical protein